MRTRTRKTLAKRGAATLAVMALVTVNAALAICQCRVAATLAGAGSPVKPACCSRLDDATQPATGGCCDPTSGSHRDCPGCTCSVASDAAMILPESRGDEAGNTLPAGVAAQAPIGLTPIASAIAVPVELPGSPPGVRLHALLCVWRN